MVTTIGVASWCPDGVALAFDEHGIHWHAPVLRKPQRFIPWKDVAGALVLASSEEDADPSEAVVLCLHDHAPNPMGARWSGWLSQELRRRFGDSIPANVLFLGDDRWTWNPSEVAQAVCERIVSPE
jgi:hypothetical protein